MTKTLVMIGTLLAAAVLMPQRDAGAVVILDSTWREDGGSKGQETKGFASALALAAQPQFAAVLAFASDGTTWGEASGTWIGNDDQNRAYILTAAHVFELPARTDAYVVRGPNGKILKIDKLWLHPRWNGDTDTRTGYDIALLRLNGPVTGIGEPPVLYSGKAEAGKLLTFVGYGSRGIGSTGQQDRFYSGSDKAAAQGVVDQFEPFDKTASDSDDAGNYLGVFLPKEDGSLKNPYGGKNRPVNRLVGLLGSGDSGGSAWIQTGGQWLLAGINSNGDNNAEYGSSSWFCRVSPHREWISRIFPAAKFQGE